MKLLWCYFSCCDCSIAFLWAQYCYRYIVWLLLLFIWVLFCCSVTRSCSCWWRYIHCSADGCSFVVYSLQRFILVLFRCVAVSDWRPWTAWLGHGRGNARFPTWSVYAPRVPRMPLPLPLPPSGGSSALLYLFAGLSRTVWTTSDYCVKRGRYWTDYRWIRTGPDSFVRTRSAVEHRAPAGCAFSFFHRFSSLPRSLVPFGSPFAGSWRFSIRCCCCSIHCFIWNCSLSIVYCWIHFLTIHRTVLIPDVPFYLMRLTGILMRYFILLHCSVLTCWWFTRFCNWRRVYYIDYSFDCSVLYSHWLVPTFLTDLSWAHCAVHSILTGPHFFLLGDGWEALRGGGEASSSGGGWYLLWPGDTLVCWPFVDLPTLGTCSLLFCGAFYICYSFVVVLVILSAIYSCCICCWIPPFDSLLLFEYIVCYLLFCLLLPLGALHSVTMIFHWLFCSMEYVVCSWYSFITHSWVPPSIPDLLFYIHYDCNSNYSKLMYLWPILLVRLLRLERVLGVLLLF